MTRRARTRSAAVRLVTTAALLLGVAACGNDTPRASNGLRPDVLQFTATLADGGEFDGTSLAGRPAVLWFWAPT